MSEFETITDITDTTGRIVITRFPPEPNGFLHLGHLKAMMLDFTYNKYCRCILRMDDTNPSSEKQSYVDGIVEDVKWLGFNYEKLTYTSDYFDKLYEFAVELIKSGNAYVDFTPSDELKEMRHSGTESTYRSTSPEINIKEFQNMKDGRYKEGEAVLRLKIDMQNNNHTLRDPIAYRINYTPHYRTGTNWVIYPSYDFSHGLVDALEEITDSYCTMEFFVRREQYYWPVMKLKDRFGLTPAIVMEFGRFNIDGVTLSKRKIIDLMNKGIIKGFDDPRLYTIRGLRRRGFTPEILKNIVSHSGTGRAPTTVSKDLIEFELRDRLDKECMRAFAVLNPVSVTIKNGTVRNLSRPIQPSDLSKGSRTVTMTSDIYIDRADFRDVDNPTYYRLAPNKTIRLKYADFVRHDSHELNDGVVKHIIVVETVPDKPKKIKGIIHWVDGKSHKAVFEIYNDLVDGAECDSATITVERHIGYVEPYVIDTVRSTDKENIVFQFERIGYYKFDRYETIEDEKVPIFIRVINITDRYNEPKNN